MACRIAEKTQHAVSIAWPSMGPGPGIGSQSVQRLAGPEQGNADLAEVTRRLHEMERNRKTELAQARDAGIQEGIRQARDHAANEVKIAAERVAQMVHDLASLKRKVRREAEGDVIKLALTVARRILHRELITDPEALQGLVHAALEKLQNREISRVRVFPAGADIIRASLDRMGAAPGIQVAPDPSLRSGDVIFETSLGDLDASIDTQLQEIQRGFADRLALR